MYRRSETTALLSLPMFPQSIGFGIPAGVRFRRFGIFEKDLDIDFSSANRAAVATLLLESCVVDPASVLPEGFFRELSIGKRIECLLILAAGECDAALGFPFKCDGCGEEMEFELTLKEISAMQSEADLTEEVSVDIGGRAIGLRKPTGRDQELWSTMSFNDEHEMAAGMIGSLGGESGLPEACGPETISTLEEALDKADPLVIFGCLVKCEECGVANEREIDLIETALGMLRQAQNRLIAVVHRLALHYHWGEKQIFAVPEWRRQRYLELIGAAK